MALSGSFYQNVGSYWRLQGEWTASQNASNNTSTITLRVYWMTTSSSYGAVYSSSSKSGSSYIEGGGTATFSATAGLSNGQKKLVDTHTRTLSHNSDGTLNDVDMSISFSPEVSLGGSYVGTVSAAADFNLNALPRESSLASTPSWTAGNNFTISVNRASSSFRHVANIYVQNSEGLYGGAIKQVELSSSQTAVSSSFNSSEMTALYEKLNGRASTPTRVILYTYNGSTLIGETQRDGTLSAPAASHPTTGYQWDWYVNQTITIPISRANPNYSHTVRFKLGSYTKTLTGVQEKAVWTPTASEQQSLYAQMSTVERRDGTIEVDTFYYGVQIRTTTTRDITFFVSTDSYPTFNGSLTYYDNNTSMTNITGNDQYIVSGKSDLHVVLPSTASAQGRNGATIVGYVAMVAGESRTVPYTSSSITFDFSTISASTNQTITIEAVDSRGRRAAISKIVNVIPYSPPTLTVSAARVNGFEETTLLKSSGRFAPVYVAGQAKNYVTLLRYRTRLKGGSWSSYTTISRTSSGTTVTGTDQTVMFDITKAYDVEFNMTDRFGSTSLIRSVSVGRPIFFIDDVLGSIAMNDFPKDPNTFLLNGRLTFAGNLYASSGEGAVGGAIDLNNGDIVRANGIYFNDVMSNSGEGLLFLKSGYVEGSSSTSSYDNLYIRDGNIFMNNRAFLEVIPGSSTGHGVKIGAGGLTIVGAGECIDMIRDSTSYSDETLYLGSDGSVKVVAGSSTSMTSADVWEFSSNGLLYRPTYKEPNGHNMLTAYATSGNTSQMIVQYREANITIAGQSYVDITWPVAFDATPDWVLVSGKEGSSVAYNMTAYSITRYGARIYGYHVEGNNNAFSITFNAVACGIKT